MDGLASMPVDQVWASSLTGVASPAFTASGQDGRSWRPHATAHHPHSQLHRAQSPPHTRQRTNYGNTSSGSTTIYIGSTHNNSGTRPRSGTAALQEAALQSSNMPNHNNESSDFFFEPLDAATRVRIDQRHTPAAGHAVRIHPPPGSSSSSGRRPSTTHSPDAMQTAASLPSSLGSNQSGSSNSSGGPRLLQRQSGSGSFLTATASQLLSSLGILNGWSLLGSSPTGSSSSSNSSSSSSRGPSSARSRSAVLTSRSRLRSGLLVRSPALLLELDVSDSYDDLLALDQFNVKRAVRPSVLAMLSSRTPTEQDAQQQAQCFICFERWVPATAAEARPDSQAGTSLQQNAGKAAAAGCCRCCCCSGNNGNGTVCQQLLVQPAAAAAAAVERTSSGSDSSVLRDQVVQYSNTDDDAGYDDSSVRRQQLQAHSMSGCWDSWSLSMFSQQQQQQSLASASSATAAAASSTAVGLSAMPNPPSPSCSRKRYATMSDKVYTQLTVVKQLPCGHEYCSDCISTWLAEHATCPICRWVFPDSQTHLINLHK